MSRAPAVLNRSGGLDGAGGPNRPALAGNVALGATRRRRTDRGAGNRAEVLELPDRVGLSGHADARPAAVSGGMAQWAVVARALISRPGVLLLDEPFAPLDALTRLTVQDVVSELTESLGTTVLLVTHDVEQALRPADRVAVLGRAGSGTGDVLDLPPRVGRLPRDTGDPAVAPALAPLRRRLLRDAGLLDRPAARVHQHAHPRTPHAQPHQEISVPTARRSPSTPRTDSASPSRRSVLAASAALVLAAAGCAQGETGSGTADADSGSGAGAKLDTLSLDHAYDNPASLVLEQKGWLSEALAPAGTKVTWQLSAGSNKANELLRGNAVQLGSTAGATALLARSNGSPLRIVDVLAEPEWTAVVVDPRLHGEGHRGRAGQEDRSHARHRPLLVPAADPRRGRDPADRGAGGQPPARGRAHALARGDVDAWMGRDPIMATAQQADGARLLVRDPDRASYSVLNAREDFATAHPDVLLTVLGQYERARAWIRANSARAVTAYADAAKLSPAVAQVVLGQRTDLGTSPVPGAAQEAVFSRLLPTFVTTKQVGSRADADTALSGLFLSDPITAAALRAVPLLAWVGVSELPEVVMCAIGAFFPVLAALVFGIRGRPGVARARPRQRPGPGSCVASCRRPPRRR